MPGTLLTTLPPSLKPTAMCVLWYMCFSLLFSLVDAVRLFDRDVHHSCLVGGFVVCVCYLVDDRSLF